MIRIFQPQLVVLVCEPLSSNWKRVEATPKGWRSFGNHDLDGFGKPRSRPARRPVETHLLACRPAVKPHLVRRLTSLISRIMPGKTPYLRFGIFLIPGKTRATASTSRPLVLSMRILRLYFKPFLCAPG